MQRRREKRKKIYYYSDELNDDFAGTNIAQKPLPPDYRYFSRNPIRKFAAFVLYRLVVTPIVFFYMKILRGERVKNKKALRGYKKEGFFLYANHTRSAGDAFTPTEVAFPKKPFIIVNPDAASLPVVRTIVPLLGGVPLPTDRRGMKNFHDAVLKHAEMGHCVMIYPEAHIWPYYTKIRPFKDSSFRYPAESGKPVFTFTTTYRKRRFSRLPKTTVWIDGPFFPDPALSVKENQRALRQKAYEAMVERSKLSTYEYREYVRASADGTAGEENFSARRGENDDVPAPAV